MNNDLRNEIQQMIDQLDSQESFQIETAGGEVWEIGASDCWIGGWFEGDEVGSDYLGNVVYSKSTILDTLIKELEFEIVGVCY